MNAPRKVIKCVVWDLDHTIWNGVLVEGDEVSLRPGVVEAIKAFDERGILQSIASRNERDSAIAALEVFGLAEYFLYPQIHWNPKVSSVESIAAALNIGLDSLALIDDDPFERGQVQEAHPEITCFDAVDIGRLPSLPDLMSEVTTDDARARRHRYMSEMTRAQAEESYEGPREGFLATLGLVLTVTPARADDLPRAAELMVRTHQLNTTGLTYSEEELARLTTSPNHLLLMASLEDRYGDYGKIGVALVETTTDWTIKLLLMSCRVASRGVGTVLIHHLRDRAKARGVRLLAEFVETPRNRQMYITYRFAGFHETERRGAFVLLESDQTSIAAIPAYVNVVASGI